MKHTIKAILLFFTAALLITSCSSNDPTPPKAGFTLDPSDVIQWDTSLVINTSTGSDVPATYEVTGGEFIYLGNTIQFLEAKIYTIKQTVENEDGIDTYSMTVDVAIPGNKYVLDGVDQSISESLMWVLPQHGSTFMELSVDIAGDDYPTVIKMYPIIVDTFVGDYPYDGTEEPAAETYILRVSKNSDGTFSGNDWSMDFSGSDGGSNLVIKLVYEDKVDSDNNVYDITIESYTLSTGGYNDDFEFEEESKKSFSFMYRGVVDPIQP